MNILITHTHNTLNYGSAMMAINAIQYLNKTFPKCSIFCAASDFHINRLIEATNNYEIQGFPEETQDKYGRNIFKHLDFHLKLNTGAFSYTKLIKKNKIDLVIVLGGDDFSSQGSLTMTPNNMRINQYINKHICKVVYLGHNMGPYYGIRKHIYKNLLRGPLIITRDSFSFNYLKNELSLSNIKEGRDLAFLDLPKLSTSVSNILFNDIEGQYIVLIPSGAYKYYSFKNKEETIDAWMKVAYLLLKRFPNHKLVLLSHVFNYNTANNDCFIVNGIYKDYPNKDRLIPINSVIQPAIVRNILSKADFVFTARMHPSISSYVGNTIALTFAYSQKYKNLIADGLELPELVIDARETVVGSDDFIHKLNDRIDLIVNNKKEILIKLNKQVEIQKEISMKSFSFIKAYLES